MQERGKEGKKNEGKKYTAEGEQKLKHLRTGWMGLREFLQLSKQQKVYYRMLCDIFFSEGLVLSP